MGKNAHPPRGQKNSKSTEQTAESTRPQNEGSSATAKADKKKDKSGTDDAKPAAAPETKKPDVRTLIGGASWTGKLPMNILSEHCQKQKWDKPEYSMIKNDEGFSSMVTLRSKDPKTQEVTTLPPFKLPPDHKHLATQPTAVEARHFAAAYALFRVCSMRNIHMMMPPTYRDLWKGDFQQLKSEDERAGMSWKYDADPFQTHREREKIQKQREAAAKTARPSNSQSNSVPGISTNSTKVSMKGWNTVAKVEMGIKTRREVERLARSYSLWNPSGIQILEEKRKEIIEKLSALGFRNSHIEEATHICKDQEEVLEWLLIHVPEDDLPKWCLPEGYVAGISLASGDLRQDAAVKRLAVGGYSNDICQSVYEEFHGDERCAAQALQDSLLGYHSPFKNGDSGKIVGPNLDEQDTWKEEQEVLASIYEQKYQLISDSAFSIQFEISGMKGQVSCKFMRPCRPYPGSPPIIILDANVPAHIRLSITRQALEYANEHLLGEQMIFNMVDWIERESSRIVANPGPLADVANTEPEFLSQDQLDHVPAEISSKKSLHSPGKKSQWSTASKDLWSKWQRRQESPQQKKMMESRRSLPAWKLQEALVSAVTNNQVVIVSGETGSGKSTQSVQFILDDMIKNGLGESANIICTQPRRISAMGLADRVSQERCSAVGEEIGYAIRGESKQSRSSTKVMFVTTGVLLRRLQMAGRSMEDVKKSLADISHVFVDEVHERTLDTDFLLALLRDAIKERKDLKVILMSATLDANIFEEYFGGPRVVAKVEIQGRTYPVEDMYLDDAVRETGFRQGQSNDNEEGDVARRLQHMGMGINYDLIVSLVQQIDYNLGTEPGGILVFLPGTVEIQKVVDKFQNNPDFYALPLHASLLPAEQRRVFPQAPSGKRKVIAATNVAETSITIDDIVAVIDTGRVKETRYDPQTNMVKLEEVWASRAACQQRRGRAGRVRAGQCFKLYTRNAESKMKDRPDPEIRRVPLEQLCLSVKAMGVADVPSFLANTLTPPEQTAVEGALDLLRRIGALEEDTLTALGQHLSMIPADIRCAKLMVYGALFDYLEECLIIASILSVKSPFVNPLEKREESKAARLSFAYGQGDLIADLNAYRKWTELRADRPAKEVRAWCQDNFLSPNTLFDISSNRSQYLTTLKEIGFIPLGYKTPDQHKQASYPFLNAIVLSALHPQVLRISLPAQKYQSTISGALPVDPESREIKYFDSEDGRVFVHPSSTMFSAQSFPNNSTFLSYYKKAETSKVFVNELTPCGSYGLMLFGGPIEVDTQGRGLIIDGWARLRGWARIGMLISRLRVILDRVLNSWIDKPGFASGGDMEKSLVSIVKKLVELEGMDA